MNYFVNEYVLALNSGVEHAEFKRQAIFKHAGVPSKIITRDLNRSMHRMAAEFGMDQEDMLNMYDFFQHTVEVKPKRLTTKDLHLPIRYQVDPDANVSKVYDGDRLVMNIHHTPGRVNELFFTEFFDEFGNITNQVLYDSRGFKSSEIFLNHEGKVFAEVVYNAQGKRALERYYEVTQDGKGTVLFNIRLINYKGRDYYFNTEDDLFTFFLDEVNTADGFNDVFIADRPSIANKPLVNMQTPAKKYLWFPIAHAVDPNDQIGSELDGNYKNVLSNSLNKFDGLITMTKQQSSDLQNRLKTKTTPFYVIPGAAITDEQLAKPVIPAVNKKDNKVLYVGRLDEAKRVGDLIRAFALVVRQVPDAQLDIRGYGSNDYVDSLTKLIKDIHLEDHAKINGYTPKIEAVYDTAKVFATATLVDGFPLSMVEALGHGLPLVAFDINYGPKEIITDGLNGRLIANGDVYNFAQALIKLLQDPAELQTLSDGACKTAKSYSMDELWQLWSQIADTRVATSSDKKD